MIIHRYKFESINRIHSGSLINFIDDCGQFVYKSPLVAIGNPIIVAGEIYVSCNLLTGLHFGNILLFSIEDEFLKSQKIKLVFVDETNKILSC